MVKYLLKRLSLMVVTLFVIATATFFLMNSMPGNPVTSQAKKLPAEVAKNMEIKYGLDKPVTERYVIYLKNLIKGDLGDSFVTPGISVNDKLKDNFPPSVRIGLQSVAFGLIVGVLLGVIAGFKRETPIDYVVMFIAILGVSIPSFVLATLIQLTFGGKGGIPIAGWYDPSTPFFQQMKYVILPTLALSFGGIATYARYMRASVLEVISQDYILTAKAKGLSSFAISVKHILRNAILPIITILGPQIATIITGTVVIERIFAIPGIGNALIDAIYAKDYNIIMGLTVFFSALYILSILIVDILYSVIDPRIKLEGK
ncbi:ABC transporter permease [Eubacterium multiforme]|uniref:Oligopeptide transport system permease protein n=1 Tax=Eubacterium multiforme TaxID=83339 RepID=A0ABT9UX06_9FIRM|nr:ABC transporter permease [Eubacterium multiforme]MDQ0150860.1 oligopeptide transport system permease protein [Eubacterium multiforme]